MDGQATQAHVPTTAYLAYPMCGCFVDETIVTSGESGQILFCAMHQAAPETAAERDLERGLVAELREGLARLYDGFEKNNSWPLWTSWIDGEYEGQPKGVSAREQARALLDKTEAQR
jgi:hypothetical protein